MAAGWRKSTLISDEYLMPAEIQIEAIDAWRYRIARDERRGMRTDVVVYASAVLMEQIRKDLSLEQAMNVATLPGIAGHSLAMPDIHQGYGFPIGGVAAMDFEDGVVSQAAWASISTAACAWCGRRWRPATCVRGCAS